MALKCVTNGAYISVARDQADAIRSSARIETAINTALALWQRNSSASVANMQEEIAKRQRKLADYIHEHAKKFWPYEKAFVDDAFGVSKTSPPYAALAAQWGALSKDSLRKGKTDWLAEAKRRCLSPTRCEGARWDREAQRARTDVLSFADRHAEARAEALNDMRYSRMYAALALGRGQLNNVASFESIMGSVGMNAAHMLSNSISSGLELLGYATTRRSFDGWGQGARQQAYMQYTQDRPNTIVVPAPSKPEAMPVIIPKRDEPLDPCGPQPAGDASDEVWRRYYDCKGWK